jgi:hypothetical protein
VRREGLLRVVVVAIVGSAGCGGEVTLHLLSGLGQDAGDAFDAATSDRNLGGTEQESGLSDGNETSRADGDADGGETPPPIGVAVEVVSNYSGTCLDVGSSKQPGSMLSLTVCQGLAEQLLVLRKDGTNGTNGASYSMLNPNSGLCVAVEEKDGAVANETGLELAKCSDVSTQLFDAERTTGGYVFTSEAEGLLCIDDEAFGAGNGAPLIMYACNAGTNQQWSLR